MTFSITFEADQGFILMKIDEINHETSVKAIQETSQLVELHHCFCILSDYRNTKMTLSTIDIYQLHKKWINEYNARGISPSKPKRAILLEKNQANFADFRFIETTALNNNQRVKIFTDYSTALNWLEG